MEVEVELYSTFVEEEDLLSLVTLVVQPILINHSDLFEQRHDVPDELLLLVLEELDFGYDVLVSKVDNSLFEDCWQIIDQLLVIELVQRFFMIVFDKLLDPFLKRCWKPLSFRELSKHRQFLLQVSCFDIDTAYQSSEVTNGE